MSLLGPLSLRVDGVEVVLGSRKQAAILAVLATSPGAAVAAERLIDVVWGDDATDRVEHALQQQVSTLRKALEPDRAPRAESKVLVTRRQGYELIATVDAHRFEQLAAAAGAPGVAPHDALTIIDEALAMWRGRALSDCTDSVWLSAAGARLDEQRLALVEARAAVLMQLGRHGEVIGDAESVLAANPFREGAWALLMQALYCSGRQADAIAAFGRARSALVDELGLEPGPELRDLERRILSQDPDLLAPAPAWDALSVPETYRSGTVQRPHVRFPDGQIVVLNEGDSVIGRLPDATIRLNDSRASRRHALLRWDGDHVELTDLASTNGTFVDDQMVAAGAPVRLSHHSVIRVGGVELRLHAELTRE